MPVDSIEAEKTLLPLLSSVERPGSFCAYGAQPSPLFRLDVAGVGTLSFPVPPQQAELLVAIAERAPYGRGPDTLVDTDVRRAWQINADRVSLPDETWADTLSQIVQRAKLGLGLGELEVEAELYKLLVYDAGSFFVAHRDTEKQPGMFATLVIVLPSLFRGGALAVSHLGETVELPMQAETLAELPFAAFYADCTHELRPVTEGWRVALVYNLVRKKGADRTPQAPDNRSVIGQVSSIFSDWVRAGSDWPHKIVLPLEHHYTLDSLSFAALKNRDRAVASVVVEAARRAECTVHLAMISIEERGAAEPTYDSYSYRDYDEDDEEEEDVEYEVIEVDEREQSLSDFKTPEDTPAELPSLPIEEGELWPDDALDDEEPDEDAFYEATGNGGASFERTYRRAALVLWPTVRTLDVLLQESPDAVLSGFEQRLSRWDGRNDTETHRALRADARRIVAGWSSSTPEARSQMVAALVRMRETELLEAFVRDGMRGRCDEPDTLLAAAKAIGSRAGAVLAEVIAGSTARGLKSCASLLGRISRELPAHALLPAQAVVEVFTAAFADAIPSWQRPKVDAQTLSELLSALWLAGDVETCNKAVSFAIERLPIDEVLVPAAVTLAAHAKDQPGWSSLRGACAAHLSKRASEPLVAPADFARPCTWACKCEDCLAARKFLADPKRESWSLKAIQNTRDHVSSCIQSAGADLDLQTIKKGSPHTLQCTKNTRSYERRVAQRKEDLAALAALGVSPP